DDSIHDDDSIGDVSIGSNLRSGAGHLLKAPPAAAEGKQHTHDHHARHPYSLRRNGQHGVLARDAESDLAKRPARLRSVLVGADVVAGQLGTMVVVDVDGHRGRWVGGIDRRAAVFDAVIATATWFGDVGLVELRLAGDVADAGRWARVEQRVIDHAR